MLHASEHTDSPLTPVTDMLGRVSAELQDIAAAVERMHPLVSAQQAISQDPGYLQALQSIDHIEQKMRCLAGFLTGIAQAAAPGWQIDPRAALAAITLSDLAMRLGGGEPTAQEASSFGDFELF